MLGTSDALSQSDGNTKAFVQLKNIMGVGHVNSIFVWFYCRVAGTTMIRILFVVFVVVVVVVAAPPQAGTGAVM